MPNRNGTGPLGQGSGTGRGGQRGGRRGGIGAGPSGYCVCSKCGEKIVHTTGVPCIEQKCPKCGALMVRGS